MFAKPCDQVSTDDPFEFTLAFSDPTVEKGISLNKSQLLLDAAAIGKPNECYLGIYKIGIKSNVQDTYYFGTPFLDKYYVSFSL